MTHHHGGGSGPTWSERADVLVADATIGLGWARPAIEWLAGLVDAKSVVDVGAGPGVFALALADAFTGARVTAVDGSSDLLARARDTAARHGLGDRFATVTADLDGDLGHLPDADLIWASRVLHHVPDQAAVLAGLADRLSTGGVLAVVEGGLPTRFLPTENGIAGPGFAERLDAAVGAPAHDERAHDHRAGADRPTLDWLDQLAAAGLRPVRSRTFLLDHPAPVAPVIRRWLTTELARARESAGHRFDPSDRAALDRLLDPDEPLGLARRPDLFLLSASTVHVARRPGPADVAR